VTFGIPYTFKSARLLVDDKKGVVTDGLPAGGAESRQVEGSLPTLSNCVHRHTSKLQNHFKCRMIEKYLHIPYHTVNLRSDLIKEEKKSVIFCIRFKNEKFLVTFSTYKANQR
jgi:hypothetical protein